MVLPGYDYSSKASILSFNYICAGVVILIAACVYNCIGICIGIHD